MSSPISIFQDVYSRKNLGRIIYHGVLGCALSLCINNITTPSKINFFALSFFITTFCLLNENCRNKRNLKKAEAIIQESRNDTSSKKGVILYLRASYDSERGLPHNLKLLEDLAKEYILYSKTISSVEQLKSAITETAEEIQPQRIKCLWMYAHGNAENICLENNDKGILTGDERLEETFALLDLRATILLASCSTGGKSKYRIENVAQRIANLSGKTVFAPSWYIHQYACTVNENPKEDELSFRFQPFYMDVTKKFQKSIWGLLRPLYFSPVINDQIELECAINSKGDFINMIKFEGDPLNKEYIEKTLATIKFPPSEGADRHLSFGFTTRNL